MFVQVKEASDANNGEATHWSEHASLAHESEQYSVYKKDLKEI